MPPQLTIIGLGLIGGSLGMALRRARLGYEIVGWSRRRDTIGRAQRLGAIDKGEWNLPAAVERASMVVVATPPQAVREIFQAITQYLPEGCVVTDVASTKEQIMAWAEELLPRGVSFVGGHPMAGKELSGIEVADPDLFNGCVYCLVPSRIAQPRAVEGVIAMVKAVGAEPRFLDAAEHDGLVAGISHLPFLLSTALVNVTTQSTAWREMGRMAAGGFRDTTRLASGDPIMHRDICLTNSQSILRWIDTLSEELAHLRQLVESGSEELETILRQAKECRDRWQARGVEEPSIQVQMPSPGDQMRSLFVGEWGRRPPERRR